MSAVIASLSSVDAEHVAAWLNERETDWFLTCRVHHNRTSHTRLLAEGHTSKDKIAENIQLAMLTVPDLDTACIWARPSAISAIEDDAARRGAPIDTLDPRNPLTRIRMFHGVPVVKLLRFGEREPEPPKPPADTEPLAHALEAVLMFHTYRAWTRTDMALWKDLTGTDQATPRALCEMIRQRLAAAGYQTRVSEGAPE